ncbi:hypothetical protein ACP4OV_003037 [Aristida adscensionis]
MRQFLKGLSGVTHLYFEYKGQKLEMERNLELCPHFDNLTVLTLVACWPDAEFFAFTEFFQKSPNLVKLTLKVKKTFSRSIGELKDISFTCEHLETVEIVCLEGRSAANSLEKLLLERGIASSQMERKRHGRSPSIVVTLKA